MVQKELLNDFYAEPLNEEILGSFLEYTAAMGAISTRKRMEDLLREWSQRQEKDPNTLIFPKLTLKIFLNHNYGTSWKMKLKLNTLKSV